LKVDPVSEPKTSTKPPREDSKELIKELQKVKKEQDKLMTNLKKVQLFHNFEISTGLVSKRNPYEPSNRLLRLPSKD